MVRPGKMVRDDRKEHLGISGLVQESRPTDRVDLLRHEPVGAKNDDREVRELHLCSDRAKHVAAVHVRQAPVENDEAALGMELEQIQRGRAVLGHEDTVSLGREERREHLAGFFVVVNDEDGIFRRHSRTEGNQPYVRATSSKMAGGGTRS
jgi:hypothetical protein